MHATKPKPRRQISVERNPKYWEAGKPYLDRVVFRDISGAVVGVQRLVTGEVDETGWRNRQWHKRPVPRSATLVDKYTVLTAKADATRDSAPRRSRRPRR